jgi:hypothetical protein
VGETDSIKRDFFLTFFVLVILLIAHTANCGLVESSELITWKNDGTVQTQYYIVLKQHISRYFLTHPRTMEHTNTMNCMETGFKDMGMIRVNWDSVRIRTVYYELGHNVRIWTGLI